MSSEVMGKKSKKPGRSFQGGAVVALSLVFLTACGKNKENSTFNGIEGCGAADQTRSYMNPMDSTQVQVISIDSGFNSEQISKIERAVETWNAKSRQIIGRDAFRTQSLQLSASSTPSPSDNCGFPGTSSAFSIVKVTDQATWAALGFQSNNPGVTIRCTTEDRDFAKKQVILINPTNMISMPTIFETVIVHELGHAIGLDHSCDAANRGIAGYVGCNSDSVSAEYHEAAMYPYIDASHLKEDLRANDEERGTCALTWRP